MRFTVRNMKELKEAIREASDDDRIDIIYHDEDRPVHEKYSFCFRINRHFIKLHEQRKIE